MAERAAKTSWPTPVSASTIPLITLEGSGRERGEAHGEQARDLILECTERWRDALHRRLSTSADRYLDALVDRTGFVETGRRIAGDLVDEVEGIASASGVDCKYIWALNLFDEDC